MTLHKLLSSARKMLGTAGVIVTLAGDPVPAARPRISRWGTYYPPRYTAWRKDAAAQAATQGDPTTPPLPGPLLVVVESVVTKPPTGKKLWPRGDVDNYAKGPLDVLTKAGHYWTDDDAVVGVVSTKRYADPGEKPRTIIHIIPIEE